MTPHSLTYWLIFVDTYGRVIEHKITWVVLLDRPWIETVNTWPSGIYSLSARLVVKRSTDFSSITIKEEVLQHCCFFLVRSCDKAYKEPYNIHEVFTTDNNDENRNKVLVIAYVLLWGYLYCLKTWMYKVVSRKDSRDCVLFLLWLPTSSTEWERLKTFW